MVIRLGFIKAVTALSKTKTRFTGVQIVKALREAHITHEKVVSVVNSLLKEPPDESA